MNNPLTGESRRRSLIVPDKLWYRAGEAAARESRRTGEQVSVSEYFRRSVEERLQREEQEDGT